MARDLLTAERRNQIAQMLLHNGSVKAKELSEQYGVSTETIRKDIMFLEQEGIAKRSYGGATVAKSMLELSVEIKQTQNVETKERIAAEALRHIPPNASIILDAGSTTGAIAQMLAREAGLTIFTNSLPALQSLMKSKNQVYAFGGMIRQSSFGIIGNWANDEVRGIRADVAFVGTDGFKELGGPATASYEEAEFKKAVVAASDRSYIVADSSKFQVRTLFQFCPWGDVDCLITDRDAPEEDLDTIRTSTRIITV